MKSGKDEGNRIVFLHSEITGYWENILNLFSQQGCALLVFHLENDLKVSPYRIVGNRDFEYVSRGSVPIRQMYLQVVNFRPDVVVVSGWMDAGYLVLSSLLRAKRIKVITMFDDQWRATPRQIFGSILMKIGLRQILYSGAWVCGDRQREFARRMGFCESEIRSPLLSADVDRFNSAALARRKHQKWPRRFLFVGRLEPHKGLGDLLLAWESLDPVERWPLTVIGSGSLAHELQGKPGITHISFSDSKALALHAARSGCFVLPSHREGWGVVVHEAAASGLPIIVSEEVGAGDTFVSDGINGFVVKTSAPTQLAAGMQKIMALDDATLAEFGRNSLKLSHDVTPETSIEALLSFLPNHQASTFTDSP